MRSIPRVNRHSKIMAVFGDLAPGKTFVLVNDHDPLWTCRVFVPLQVFV